MRQGLLRACAPVVAVLALTGCVVWPAGAGPDAGPVPLARALELQGRGEAVLIDVRSEGAWAAGHLPGALNIPANLIEARASEIRRIGKLPVLYCG